MKNARDALLEAGRRLSGSIPLSALDAGQLCAAAGAAPQDFAQAFGDLPGYLLALQQQFMDRLRDKIVAVTSGVPSGIRRIELATETFLSGCLQERALRAWLLDARAWPAVFAGLRRQNQTYSVIIGSELKTLGWPAPQAAARVYLAMVLEASIVEHRRGAAVPETREVLWDFLRRGGP
ncbi:MAG: hypothetical protein ACLGI7_05555 [Gammaproteobacteria bacterium]